MMNFPPRELRELREGEKFPHVGVIVVLDLALALVRLSFAPAKVRVQLLLGIESTAG